MVSSSITTREEDRANAVCSFCDTDFVGVDGVNGGKFRTGQELAAKAASLLPSDLQIALGRNGGREHRLTAPMVVFTGGEPLLQLDESLIHAFQTAGFFTAVETNGTLVAPTSLDWICVSPKGGATVLQRSGDELKVVFGQDGLDLEALVTWDFSHFYLQPMDCNDIDRLTKETIDYCKAHPIWKLSLQTHKILNIP